MYPLTKQADEWADYNRALNEYKKLLNSLRENASREIEQILDQIDERASQGEDLGDLIDEYRGSDKLFDSYVQGASEGASESYSKGQSLQGKDSDGNEVSGEYVRSVFGRPQINVGGELVVLSEVD